MLTRLKTTLAATALFAFASCETIRDGRDDCGVWLEFVFDHNMEYADSFDPQVRTVDVYIFDGDGRFVETRRASADELDGRKRMFIDDLPTGEYTVVAVGNLAAPFDFTAAGAGRLTPGVTSIGEAVLALDTAHASREFGHLFLAPPVEIEYREDLSVYRVPFVRETNRFDVVLQIETKGVPDGTVEGPTTPTHTVEIEAPEAGAYDWLNNPVARHALLYRPWSLLARIEYTEAGTLRETAARLNTMRLLGNEWNGYRITVRDVVGGEVLWANDLLSLLAATKPAGRPDGTELPRSEYFDRKGDWNIVIVYKQGEGSGQTPDPSEGAFVAIRIYVNGRIVWQHGMDV